LVLEAIEPRRLYRQVADQIRGYVEVEGFPAGTRLPTERDLAERLNVSRPTIREALIALEVEGLVRIRVGSGIYVAEPAAAAGKDTRGEHDGPFELLRARVFIEGAVMEAAAPITEADHLAVLDEAIEAMARNTDDLGAIIRFDRAFHVGVAAILGNSVITGLVSDLFHRRMSPYYLRLAEHFETEASWQQTIAEHRAIRDALAAHDSAGAREALRRHLTASQERYSRSFGEAESETDERAEGQPRKAAGRS